MNLAIAFYNKLLGQSLTEAFSAYNEFASIHQFNDFNTLQQTLESNSIDFLLIDEFFADKYTLEKVLGTLKAQKDVKVIMLAENKDVNYLRQMMQTGVAAYVSPQSSLEEIFTAIKTVKDGKQYISTDVLFDFATREEYSEKHEEPVAGEVALTKREKQVLSELSKEKSPAEIAKDLNMSVFTVNFHLKNLRQKLNSKNTIGLVRYSLEREML